MLPAATREVNGLHRPGRQSLLGPIERRGGRVESSIPPARPSGRRRVAHRITTNL